GRPIPGEKTYTLVTGDVVAAAKDAKGNYAGRVVRDAKPVGDVSFMRVGDAFYALPKVAGPAIASGRLDSRLFDLATLDRSGYDDASVSSLPMVVTGKAGTAGAKATAAAPSGTAVVRNLPSVRGEAVRLARAKIGQFWSGMAAK